MERQNRHSCRNLELLCPPARHGSVWQSMGADVGMAKSGTNFILRNHIIMRERFRVRSPAAQS
jgi:hypothetical protein